MSKKRRDRKVINWKQYNQALVQRGKRLLLYITEERLKEWKYTGNRLPGGKLKFSDACILDVMGLKELHGFAYRQLEGFLHGLLALLGACHIDIPSYSCLQKRAAGLEIPKLNAAVKPGSVIAIDSSGLKVVGQGEWRDYKHKNGRKRWLKLHLIVEVESGQIVDYSLTADDVGDSTEMHKLLSRQELPQNVVCLADGGYDRKSVWKQEDSGRLKLVIPPQKGSTDRHESEARNRTVREIDEQGLEAWRYRKKLYNRNVVENAFMRYKSKTNGRMKYRNRNLQKLSIHLQIEILNYELALGKPVTKLHIKEAA
jgi:hypothetical protein